MFSTSEQPRALQRNVKYGVRSTVPVFCAADVIGVATAIASMSLPLQSSFCLREHTDAGQSVPWPLDYNLKLSY